MTASSGPVTPLRPKAVIAKVANYESARPSWASSESRGCFERCGTIVWELGGVFCRRVRDYVFALSYHSSFLNVYISGPSLVANGELLSTWMKLHG